MRFLAGLLVLVAAPAVAADPAASVYKVNSPLGSGSSVCVASGTKSLLLTAKHVADAGEVTLEVNGNSVRGRVVAVDPVYDLALLEADAALPAVPLAAGDPAVKAVVLNVGFPLGGEQVKKSGPVVGVITCLADDGTLYHALVTKLIPIPGDSGGGQFDGGGHLVGVTYYRTAEATCLAVPVTAARELLRNYRDGLTEVPTVRGPPPAGTPPTPRHEWRDLGAPYGWGWGLKK